MGKKIFFGILALVVTILAVVLLINAFFPVDESDVYFPVQKESGMPQMELAGRGWLALENGALRIKPFYFFGESYLPIWPYGYSFDVKGREVRVINQEGKVVARTGHWIKYGGGPAANMDIVKNYLGEMIPEDEYPGPYFIVGGVDN